jgi:hypothetical protein
LGLIRPKGLDLEETVDEPKEHSRGEAGAWHCCQPPLH